MEKGLRRYESAQECRSFHWTGLGGKVDGKTLSQMETAEPDLGDVDATDLSVNEGALTDDEADCDGKAEAGNRKLKTFFGRRRTHNEQLIMRPCGVIIARATFFGSEAISAVNVSHLFVVDFGGSEAVIRRLQRLFFQPPSQPQSFFIFDNNCKLDAHLKRSGDTHFINTGKPVDVFHFTSKHKGHRYPLPAELQPCCVP